MRGLVVQGRSVEYLRVPNSQAAGARQRGVVEEPLCYGSGKLPLRKTMEGGVAYHEQSVLW